MERLPDEVLLMIMERLPVADLTDSLSRVCRRWAMLVRSRVLVMKRPSESCKLHPGLHTLQVLAYLPSPGALLTDVLLHAPRLRDLTVYSAAPFTSENLADMARLTNLDHLDVFTTARAYDARLAPAARRLGSLVINESVAPGLLRALAAECNLRALYMYGRSMHYPRREMITLVRARSAHLTELVLRCSELSDPAYEIIGGCANLLALQLYSCWLMTAAAAPHVTRPRRLRKLHVTGARLVRSPAMYPLVDQLPSSLFELNLSCGWLGDEHIDVLVSCVPRLRVFEGWQCRLTRDGAVSMAMKLPELEKLDMDLVFFERHLKTLNTHPSLKQVRCLLEINSDDEPDESEVQQSQGPLKKIDFYSLKILLTRDVYEELQNTVAEENAFNHREQEGEAEHNNVCTPQKVNAHGAEGEPGAKRRLRLAYEAHEEIRVRNKSDYKFEILISDAKYARRYFRGGNEGYRATLFYYWTCNRQLEPLPPHRLPNYEDEDNGFYY